MEVVNLLKFLNSVKDLYTLEYSRCNYELENILKNITADEQFTHSVNMGIIYVNRKSENKYIIVDGLGRFVSLSLLLHAICECYKKTSKKNEDAIKTIRSKYLFCNKTKLKLHLQDEDEKIYSKIINGERLSGHEKSKPMFVLLHEYWQQIKDENLRAANIFKMLQKVNIVIAETDNVSKRDLYYILNKNKRTINQIALIDNYIDEKGISEQWNYIKSVCSIEKNDLSTFLNDFLVTKFNFKSFNNKNLYECFINYFDTLLQYLPKETIIKNMCKSAKLYYDIINLNFKNEDIRHALINIKRHQGNDTYGYILSVYEDFDDGNISESIFVEILNTIDDYLKNRMNNDKNINFNELVQYLNTIISYK